MTAFLKITALAVSFLAHGVHSVDIAFVDGADCTGIGLYGTKDIPYLPCYDLSGFDPASSIHMRNMTRDQVLHFFSDSSCQVALHSTDNTDDQCFTSPIGRFGSFQVSSSDSSLTIHGRDSSTIDTTDVVPYAIKMSNYTDMGTFDPVKIDLGLSIFTLGLGLIGLGQAITLYGAINTCVALKGPNPSPKDIFDCAIQPVSTIVTIAGTALIHAAGKRVARRFQMAEGTVINLRKRAEMIDGLNADFVHSIMNTTVEGDDIVHIGSAERNMSTGMHSSPVYQVNFGDGGLWHFSSFYEHEHGDFVHHMRPASETELEKRSASNPYNTIRWKSGGFDFAFCEYNSNSPASGFNNRNKQQVYNIAYDQITCLHSASYYRSAQGLGIDLRNEQGTVIGEVAIQPYTGSSRPGPPSCNPNSYPIDGDCQIS